MEQDYPLTEGPPSLLSTRAKLGSCWRRKRYIVRSKSQEWFTCNPGAATVTTGIAWTIGDVKVALAGWQERTSPRHSRDDASHDGTKYQTCGIRWAGLACKCDIQIRKHSIRAPVQRTASWCVETGRIHLKNRCPTKINRSPRDVTCCNHPRHHHVLKKVL
ncbi:hypothetical protein CPSG_02670 [Coccidioides posadasii str. Silveira]|uniref:Uncharacterized protein n=1 Tax=Coccidioides posadasii (strain RMSCC 757 / Silveira) TaxID=443226 RepID=E9CY00_COCPS|nr:hypothetical protein CPSG_02670 [Coccidioides posadasii str. Silveira]